MKTKLALVALICTFFGMAQVRNYNNYQSNTKKSNTSKVEKPVREYSNDSDESKFRLGVSVGMNMSTMFDGNAGSSTTIENIFRLRAGINAQYHFTPILGIKSGLHYSQIGAKYNYDDLYEAKLKTNQLQIPVLLNIRLNDTPNIYLGVGVQYGMVLSSEFDGTDYADYYAKGDLQGAFDVDIYFTDKLYMKTGMFLSLNSIIDKNVQSDYDLENESNLGLQLSLNYNFL